MVIMIALAAGALLATFVRSAIPIALTGRVTKIEVVHEKVPGIDDVHLVTVDGETTHVDPFVTNLIEEGDRVEKGAWSQAITVGGEEFELQTSPDFRRMLVALPLIVGTGLLLLFRPAARSRSKSSFL